MGNEKKLYETIMNDQTMQAEIIRAPDDEARIRTIVQMGETRRLPVSPEAVADYFRHQDSELSDNELEHVVGGKNQTKNGENDDDYIYGCDGDDTIRGNDGDDSLVGDGEFDVSGDGNDYIDGGRGNDVGWGDGGDDTLLGGSGNNTIIQYGDTTITLQGVQMTADEVWERVEQ